MACHIRIASETAKFGQPEVKLGLIPGLRRHAAAPAARRPGRALQLLLTGDMIDAQEAFRIGLVNRVVAGRRAARRGDGDDAAMLANAPLARRGVHRGRSTRRRLPLDDALDARGDGVRAPRRDRRQARRNARVSREARPDSRARERRRAARLDRASSIRDFRNLEHVELALPATGSSSSARTVRGRRTCSRRSTTCSCCDRCAARATGPRPVRRRRRFTSARTSTRRRVPRDRRRLRARRRSASACGSTAPCRATERRARRAAVGDVLARRRRADRRRARRAAPLSRHHARADVARYLAALQRYRAALAARNAALRSAARPARARASPTRARRTPRGLGTARSPSTARRSGASGARGSRRWRATRDALPRDRRETPRADALRSALAASDDPRCGAGARARGEARARPAPRAHARRSASRRSGHHAATDARAAGLRLGRPAADGRDRAPPARGGDVARAPRRARRSSCSTIRSPSSTRGARRASSTLLAREGLGQTILAVPRESDIPSGLTPLARFRIAAGVVRPPTRERSHERTQEEAPRPSADRRGRASASAGSTDRVEQAASFPNGRSSSARRSRR